MKIFNKLFNFEMESFDLSEFFNLGHSVKDKILHSNWSDGLVSF